VEDAAEGRNVVVVDAEQLMHLLGTDAALEDELTRSFCNNREQNRATLFLNDIVAASMR